MTKTQALIKLINNAKINTWFDLGLFIDKFRENKKLPTSEFNGNFDDFINHIAKGVGFITFYYSIDGVSIEIEKYAKTFKQINNNINIHYIGGEFYATANQIIPDFAFKHKIKEINGFDKWKLYKDFFITKIYRGSVEYNNLIKEFINDTIVIINKLGSYIENNNINLLYLINTNSNPGNVSLALSTMLISEFFGIPVINNNHDFYWEGGNNKFDIKTKKLKPGPRDFFFTNYDIGEFFSQIEVLFPWESRSWLQVNINKKQSEHLIKKNGNNPANVTEIGTAIDQKQYQNKSKRININTFYQFEKIFSRYNKTLVSYNINDVFKNNLVNKDNPEPILIGNKTKTIKKFHRENIIFLQPTRIVKRKNIEIGFKLIYKLIKSDTFKQKLLSTPNLKITLIVTGPIPDGQYNYFRKLIENFNDLINILPNDIKDRIFLGFLFSEFDKDRFKKIFKSPIGITELYSIASLILLPSETEGRGLPIIEAASAGIPIFCRRYYPYNVYSEVIGEHLSEDMQLKVIEFDGKEITKHHIKNITERVFYPHQFINEINHNKNVVDKRYSLKSLKNNMLNILQQIYLQTKPNDKLMQKTIKYFNTYKKFDNSNSAEFKKFVKNNNREYLPGYGRLGFLIYLKSLIDPSYFRTEAQNFKGIALNYSKELIDDTICKPKLTLEKIHEFYNLIDNIFYYKDGEYDIRHDHSFAYRHRNKNYYPFYDFTIQEITGLINYIYLNTINPIEENKIDESSHFFIDWNLAFAQFTSSSKIEIDNREILIEKLKENIPIALFPSRYVKFEIEFFVLQAIRVRLKIKLKDELTEQIIIKNKKIIKPVYIFTTKHKIGKWPLQKDIINYIQNSNDTELKLLLKHNIIRFVEHNQYSVGINFKQFNDKSLKILNKIGEQNGFLITARRDAAFMTDIADIDKFHISKIQSDMQSNIMGIPRKTGYIQYVPRAIRYTLTYPTPIQTGKDFNDILISNKFKTICNKKGKKFVFDKIRNDAIKNSSPVYQVINNLTSKTNKNNNTTYKFVSGVYNDGMPWNGVIAKANINSDNFNFKILSSLKTKTLTQFIKNFEKKNNNKVKIAWNGGYILNPELVGKLGLPESYIGSPLGLLISNNEIISAPLFNKPAILFYKDNKISIKRVNLKNGIKIIDKNIIFDFDGSTYNNNKINNKLAFFDLLNNKKQIETKGKAIVRLSGNTIKEIVYNAEKTNIIPVGLTLAIDKKILPKHWKPNYKIKFEISELKDVINAVEAGPLLVNDGNFSLDMNIEGWKTDFSIATQAARLDFTDMRGPKIAAGIDNNGNLAILAINGRIRESVGATHIDMANILIDMGIKYAMGFDPGGSSTLVVNGKTLNISPYNKNYEENIYSLPPQPRAVSNCILVY